MLELINVGKKYKDKLVLRDINFKLKDREIICILGPSGCGKSTILNLVSRIKTPSQGRIVNRSKKTGYVFQEDRLLPWKTVYENIAMVGGDKDTIERILLDTKLNEFRDVYPDKLSGGMKQRCSIARAFSYGPDLLLMDEPFKSLDYGLRISMTKSLLDVWEKNNSSILFVTHEIDEATLLGDRILVLTDCPTTVMSEYQIDIAQMDRKLGMDELLVTRNKIIGDLID